VRTPPHDLGHARASLAISAAANVTEAQKLFGYKAAVLTLDRYGHLFLDDLDAVADAFDFAPFLYGHGSSAQSERT
jgi:hypothetical protein